MWIHNFFFLQGVEFDVICPSILSTYFECFGWLLLSMCITKLSKGLALNHFNEALVAYLTSFPNVIKCKWHSFVRLKWTPNFIKFSTILLSCSHYVMYAYNSKISNWKFLPPHPKYNINLIFQKNQKPLF
jgi:hypothetical protein